MRRIRSAILTAATVAVLVLSLAPAHAATCGGPWTGPMGTNCSFVATGGPLTFGGAALGASAAVGITVFSPPGAYLTGCSGTGAGFASCTQPSSITIPPGQTVICVVKGLNAGIYSCTA